MDSVGKNQSLLETAHELVQTLQLHNTNQLELGQNKNRNTTERILKLELKPEQRLESELELELELELDPKLKLKLKLELIRKQLSQFKQLTHQKENQTKLAAILRESTLHINQLIQNNSLIPNSNNNNNNNNNKKNNLNYSILLQNLPQNQRTPLHLIEALAHHIPLESFRDSDNSNLLTIAGKLIVIDVELTPDNHCRAKFSYTFGRELEPKRDPLIDKELTAQLAHLHLAFQSNSPHEFCHLNNLKLLHNSLNQFSNSLLQLKTLDELMISPSDDQPTPSSIDYFKVFRQLIDDYHHEHLKQQPPINPDQPPIRLPITGLPITTINQFKLELIYHLSSTQLLKNPIDSSAPGPKITVSLNTNPTAQSTLKNPHSLFIAHFSPPLAVSRPTAAALAQITSSFTPVVPPPHSLHPIHTPSDEILLENLLVCLAMSPDSLPLPQPSKDHLHWLDGSNWKHKKFGKVFKPDTGSQSFRQMYSFLEGSHVESGDPSHRVGFLVSQVGFNNLTSLLNIIKIAQRQSIFNELFQSSFNPDCCLTSAHSSVPHSPDLFPCYTFLPDPPTLPGDHQLGSDQEELQEVAIDVMMNHSEYSMTIQLVLPMGQGTGEAAEESELHLVSLRLQVAPDLAILVPELSLSPGFLAHLTAAAPPSLDLLHPDPHHAATSVDVLSLSACLDRVRSLPVFLHCLLQYCLPGLSLC